VKDERQQRSYRAVLAGTRRLVSEHGFEHMSELTVRELAEGCGVAVRTLYNLFPKGKSEVLVAHVIADFEHFSDHYLKRALGNGPLGLIGFYGDLTAGLLTNAPYYRGLADFLRREQESELLGKVSKIGMRATRSLLVHAQENDDLVEWVDADAVGRHVALHNFGIYFSWARGEISDEEMPFEMQYGAGLHLIAVLRGVARETLVGEMRRLQMRLTAARHAQPGFGLEAERSR